MHALRAHENLTLIDGLHPNHSVARLTDLNPPPERTNHASDSPKATEGSMRHGGDDPPAGHVIGHGTRGGSHPFTQAIITTDGSTR